MSTSAETSLPRTSDLPRLRALLPGWYSIGWGTAVLVMLPIMAVLWLALFPTENIWPHLASTVLPVYIQSTLLLMAGTGPWR